MAGRNGGVDMVVDVVTGGDMVASAKGRTWFVTRHPGAVEWARRRGITAELIDHLDEDAIARLRPGDIVMGVLPVSVAAEVCARGARFLYLELHVPPELRGKELSADDLERLGAELVEYEVHRTGTRK